MYTEEDDYSRPVEKTRTKLIFGVGINDANYVVKIQEDLGNVDGKRRRKQIWCCPFYTKWKQMLTRCYSKQYQVKRPTYKDCTVCEEWLTFSIFKSWMEQQDWEGKELDKDLLVHGNKVYSPETCLFVSRQVNQFLVESNSVRGKYPIGVSWHKDVKKFRASISTNGNRKQIGYFNTIEQAHTAWLNAKIEQAHELAKEQTDPRVADAIIRRYEDYNMFGRKTSFQEDE